MIIFGSGQTDSVKVYYLDVSFCVVGRSGRGSPADQNVRIPYRFMNQSVFTRNYHYYYNHDDCHNHDYHKRRERKSWCQTVFSSKTSCWCENGGWGGKSTDGISWRKIGTKENRMLRNIRWTWSSSSSTWSSLFLQLASFFDLGADQNLQNQLNVKSSLDHKDLEETLTTIMRNMRNWMLWFFYYYWTITRYSTIYTIYTVQYNII